MNLAFETKKKLLYTNCISIIKIKKDFILIYRSCLVHAYLKYYTYIAGNSDQWCSDICPLEAKHTDTIFNVVRQTAYIYGRSHLIICRERTRFTTIEEDESSSLWQLLTSLHFSLLVLPWQLLLAALVAHSFLHFSHF